MCEFNQCTDKPRHTENLGGDNTITTHSSTAIKARIGNVSTTSRLFNTRSRIFAGGDGRRSCHQPCEVRLSLHSSGTCAPRPCSPQLHTGSTCTDNTCLTRHTHGTHHISTTIILDMTELIVFRKLIMKDFCHVT